MDYRGYGADQGVPGEYTISEIAADLSLNIKTVSTYHARLKQKLGAGGSADLMRYAIENHLFD